MGVPYCRLHGMLEKQQYFELINLLNRSNSTKNELTDFIFFIEAGKLYFGQPSRQKLILAIQTNSKIWQSSGYTKFIELEFFVSELLQYSLKNNVSVDKLLKESLFQQRDE